MASKLGDEVPASAVHRLTASEIAGASQVLARAFRNRSAGGVFLAQCRGTGAMPRPILSPLPAIRAGRRGGAGHVARAGGTGHVAAAGGEPRGAVLKMVRVGCSACRSRSARGS